MKTKSTTSDIIKLKNILVASIPIARKSKDRFLMRETVMRIRQLSGILEVRAMNMK